MLFDDLVLKASSGRRAHLRRTDEGRLVRDRFAFADHPPAGFFVRQVADLVRYQAIEVGEDLIDRCQLFVGEHADVGRTVGHEPLQRATQELDMLEVSIADVDEPVSNGDEGQDPTGVSGSAPR